MATSSDCALLVCIVLVEFMYDIRVVTAGVIGLKPALFGK